MSNIPTSSFESPPLVCSSEIVFLLMGHTGAGKSHFIDRAAGDSVAPVNDGLSTEGLSVQSYIVDNPNVNGADDHRSRVALVETPGFDNADKRHSDIEIVKRIASWLYQTCKDDVMIGGIIYLHDISQDNFATMYADSQVWPLKFLSSPELLQRLVLATGKWTLPFVMNDKEKYYEREQTLSGMSAWKDLLSKGATLSRYGGSRQSAWETIGTLLKMKPLRVQDVREEFTIIQKRLIATPPPKPRWGLMRMLTALFNLAFEHLPETTQKTQVRKEEEPQVNTIPHLTAGSGVNLVEILNGAQDVQIGDLRVTSCRGAITHPRCVHLNFYGPTTVNVGPLTAASPVEQPSPPVDAH